MNPKDNKQNTVTPPDDPVNVDEVRKAAQAEERKRVAEIEAICRKHNIDGELKDKFLAGTDGFEDIGKVRAAVLDAIVERSKKQVTPPAGKVTVEVTVWIIILSCVRSDAGHAIEKELSGQRFRCMKLRLCSSCCNAVRKGQFHLRKASSPYGRPTSQSVVRTPPKRQRRNVDRPMNTRNMLR